jgi:uncharacterized membrane protein HdeD (DUF308 family)
MADAKTISRIEKLTWVLIFIGMFTVALGLASHSRSPAAAWLLGIAGVALVASGAVLIWLRSRMRVDP